MILSLDVQSVEVLRHFSKILPNIMGEIKESTKKLLITYNQVSEGVGPHEKEFYDMLCSIERALNTSEDSLLALSKELEKSAAKIEKFLTPLEKELVGLRSDISIYSQVAGNESIDGGASNTKPNGEAKDEDEDDTSSVTVCQELVRDSHEAKQKNEEESTFFKELRDNVSVGQRSNIVSYNPEDFIDVEKENVIDDEELQR